MERVLVTGGAGFIGSHLVERLLEAGEEVWVLDCFDDYYPPALKWRNVERLREHPRFKLFEGDLRDPEWTRQALGGAKFSIVYHLAARAGIAGSVADPLAYGEMNCQATLSLLEALRRGPPTRLVFASSSSVYGNSLELPFRESDPALLPTSPYGAIKRSLELMLYTYHHLYGLPVMCLRYFTVYGPRQRPEMAISRFFRHIRRGLPITLYGDGSSERDYTYVDDIVAGTLAVRTVPFEYEILNLGGSKRVRLSELIRLIEQALGREARIERCPPRAEELVATWADIGQAVKKLGFAPRVSIEHGIQRYRDWYLENEEFLEQSLAAVATVP